MTVTWLPNGWRLIVDGDAAGGWICEVHDGERDEVYQIRAADRDAAIKEALAAHGFVDAAQHETPSWPFKPPTTD